MRWTEPTDWFWPEWRRTLVSPKKPALSCFCKPKLLLWKRSVEPLLNYIDSLNQLQHLHLCSDLMSFSFFFSHYLFSFKPYSNRLVCFLEGNRQASTNFASTAKFENDTQTRMNSIQTSETTCFLWFLCLWEIFVAITAISGETGKNCSCSGWTLLL